MNPSMRNSMCAERKGRAAKLARGRTDLYGPDGQNVAATALAEEGGHHLAVLRKLSAFSQKHKHASTHNRLKAAWDEERRHLRDTEQKLVKALAVAEANIADMLTDPFVAAELADAEPHGTCGDDDFAIQQIMTAIQGIRKYVKASISTPQQDPCLPKANSDIAVQLHICREQLTEEGHQLSQLDHQITLNVNDSRQLIVAWYKEEAYNHYSGARGGAAEQEQREFLQLLRQQTACADTSLLGIAVGTDSSNLEEPLSVVMAREDIMCSLRQLQQDRDDNQAALDAEMQTLITSAGQHGGWQEQEHFVFLKALKAAAAPGVVSSAAHGRSKHGWLMEQLSNQLPHRSREALQQHLEWHRRHALVVGKRSQLLATYADAVRQLQQRGMMHVNEAAVAAKAAAVREWEMEEQAARQRDLHYKLRVLRAAQEARDEAAAAMAAANKLAAMEAQQAEQERLMQLAAARHAAVAEYHRKRQKEQTEAQKRHATLAKLQRAERADRMVHNCKRVDFRIQQAEQQRELLAQQQVAREEEEARRQELIRQIACSVPYRDAIVNARADVLKMTAAAAAHAAQFEHIETARGHHPMFGYDAKTVFTNPAFKLAHALRQAGVGATPAAHDAIMQRITLPKKPF